MVVAPSYGMSGHQLYKRREMLEDVPAALKAGLWRGDKRLIEDEVDDLGGHLRPHHPPAKPVTVPAGAGRTP